MIKQILRGSLVVAEVDSSDNKLNTFKCDGFFPIGGDYVIISSSKYDVLEKQNSVLMERLKEAEAVVMYSSYENSYVGSFKCKVEALRKIRKKARSYKARYIDKLL